MNAWPTDGCIIKNATDTFAPGGKTVNVARWLAIRGATVACGGLLGEDNAVMFEKELKKYGIEDRFVRIPGSTRVNEMFVTPKGSFKVNRPAFPGVRNDGVLAVAVAERIGLGRRIGLMDEKDFLGQHLPSLCRFALDQPCGVKFDDLLLALALAASLVYTIRLRDSALRTDLSAGQLQRQGRCHCRIRQR